MSADDAVATAAPARATSEPAGRVGPGAWLARLRDETGDPFALSLARVGFGLVFLEEVRRDYLTLSFHYFGEVFHWPLIPEALVPGRGLYEGLLVLALGCGVAITVGVAARPALLVAALLKLWFMLSDRLYFHNYRFTLICFSTLLALTPCDRYFALARRRVADCPLWARRALMAQVSLMYFASAGTKLADADWRDGRMMAVLVERFSHFQGRGVPAWLVAPLSQPWAAAALARGALASELFLGLALWSRRLRPLAFFVGFYFHLTISLASPVTIFTFEMLCAYLAFVTPDVRARRIVYDPAQGAARAAARAVRGLDWLRRLTVEERPGSRFLAVDRDGVSRSGIGALALLMRALPLLFPLWLPIALAAWAWERIGAGGVAGDR